MPESPFRVIDISNEETRVNLDTVRRLKAALKKAEAGELAEVVVAGISSDGDTLLMVSPSLDRARRVGLLEMAKFTWLADQFEDAEEFDDE